MKQKNREKLQRVCGSLSALRAIFSEEIGSSALYGGLLGIVEGVIADEDKTESEENECND